MEATQDISAKSAGEAGSKLISSKRVNNEGDPRSKLWLIGEAPGETEERLGRPFIGPSWDMVLGPALASLGKKREEVFIANLCPYRPSRNNFEFLEGSTQLSQGVSELASLATIHKPNCILLLGAKPLKAFTSHESIGTWRGSILPSSLVAGQKVMATYHPAAVIREIKQYPIFQIDLKRAINESQFPELSYSKRNYVLNPPVADLKHWIGYIKRNCDIISVDIESIRKGQSIICVGFGLSSDLAICVGWDSPEKVSLIREILEDPQIEKIFHNGTFDTEVLFLNGINVKGYHFDTMVAAHVMEPELRRGLDFLTSIYTREPYYKKEGRAALPDDSKAWSSKDNKDDVFIYNGKDCAVTFEIYESQLRELHEQGLWSFFRYEMSLVPVATHISRSGIRVNLDLLDRLRVDLEQRISSDQNHLYGLIGKEVNVNSNPQVCKLLFEDLKLPKRLKDSKLTTGNDALISLTGYCKSRLAILKQDSSIKEWKQKLDVLTVIISIRENRKLLSSYVKMKLSNDGRARSTYKVAATKTGRFGASKYVDDTGLNSQTFPRGDIELSEGEDE